MKFINISTTLIIFLLFTSCSSQDRTETIEFDNPYLFNAEIEKKVTEDTVSWKHQVSAGEYASKGDFKNALKHWSKAFGGADRNYTNSEIDSINSNYKIVSAKEYILQEAKNNRVIIINEAHHYSSHRVFTESLLQDLFDQGYRNLGIEALSNGNKIDSKLNQRKYGIQESGYYTQDPNFGNLLRTALDLGFNVFAYEQTGDLNGKEREIAQAKNIQQLMEQKPNEKFLIHCGFDHALEGEHGGWAKAMAGRLKEFTGVDPLSINQVKYSERNNRNFNQPLLKALEIQQASVLVNSENKPLRYEKRDSWSDIAVLHPNTSYIKERPNWLITADKQLIEFKKENIEISYPIMVLAYKKEEDINQAIPADIIELESKADKSYLVLEDGAYTIVVTNQKDQSFKYELMLK